MSKEKIEFLNIEQELICIKEEINKGNLENAEDKVKEIILNNDIYMKDPEPNCFAFSEPIESDYYCFKFEKEDVKINTEINIEVFLIYAYILIEKHDYDEALKIINQGLKHNPFNLNLLNEKAEIYKIKGDLETLKKVTDECLEYAYTDVDLARAYRNYGYMYIEKDDLEGAICCYLASIQYDETEIANNQLNYIIEKTKTIIDVDYYYENIEKIFSKRGIQLGPNEDICEIAYVYAQNFETYKNFEAAYYYYSILYNLTEDEEAEIKLKEIHKFTNNTVEGRK